MHVPSQFVSPFKPGDLVVHATHGISRYIGTKVLKADDGSQAEYIELDYAEGDRVFVPIEHIGRLSKHSGEDVRLARLTASVERRTPYTRSEKPAAPPVPPAQPPEPK
jgi:transcription-repair coupling factor (superfamily II helicase)